MDLKRNDMFVVLFSLYIVYFIGVSSQNSTISAIDDGSTLSEVINDGIPNTTSGTTTALPVTTETSQEHENPAESDSDETEQLRLKLKIPLKNKIVHLDLRQNIDMPSSIPLYIAHEKYSFVELSNLSDIYLYQDTSKHASFVKWNSDRDSGMLGVFEDDGETFSIEPVRKYRPLSSDQIGLDGTGSSDNVMIGDEEFTLKPVPNVPKLEDIVILSERSSSKSESSESENEETSSSESDDVTNKRKKRSYNTYEVELFLIIDYSIFNKWERNSKRFYYRDRENEAIDNIRFTFAHILNGMDARFRTIREYDYRVFLRPVGMYIAKSPRASFWTEYNSEGEYVEGYTALDALQSWINSPENRLPSFDHLSLFTAYELYNGYLANGDRRTFNGIADIPGVCGYKRASINWDHGVFSSIQTGAHEVAHSLGAFHDGYDNNCRSRDQYIMAVSPGVVTPTTMNNPLEFSRCSIQDIREHMYKLRREENNCLQSRDNYYADNSHRNYLYQLPGQRYSADEQCKSSYGPNSYYCGGGHLDEQICLNMQCWDTYKRQCYSNPEWRAADGTMCGDHRWCKNGVCEYDSRAPYNDQKSCLYGDFKGKVKETGGNFMCRYIEPHKCYDTITKSMCCETCDKIRKEEDSDCEYGDRDPDYCRNVRPTDCYDTALKKKCCSTCERLKRQNADPGCEYGDKATFCSSIYDYQCYSINTTCCETCKHRKRGPNGCEYGNKVQWCDRYPTRSCYQQSFRSQCCASCCRSKSGTAGCEWGDRIGSCSQRYCEDSSRWTDCCYTCASIRSGSCEDDPSHRSWCASRQDRECYSSYVSRTCCDTCRRRRRGNSCPYGDRYSWCNSSHCRTDARHCCRSCPADNSC